MDEGKFQYYFDKHLQMISKLDLVDHIQYYETALFRCLYKDDPLGAEQALTDLFFGLIQVPEEDQLSALRVYLVSLTTEVARQKMKNEALTPFLLSNVTALIAIIESWKTVSEYFSAVTWVIRALSSKIKGTAFISQEKSKHIIKVSQLIESNLTKELSVKSVAAQVNLNSSYLSRIFKQEMNMSVVAYINHKRILRAAVDLKYTTLSLTEIAEKYQFSSQSYFTKVFKKVHGVTPTTYRNDFITHEKL